MSPADTICKNIVHKTNRTSTTCLTRSNGGLYEPILTNVGRKRWKKESHNLQCMYRPLSQNIVTDVSKFFSLFPTIIQSSILLPASTCKFWTSLWALCTYRICNQRRLRWACAHHVKFPPSPRPHTQCMFDVQLKTDNFFYEMFCDKILRQNIATKLHFTWGGGGGGTGSVHMSFGCTIWPSHWDGSFEHQQHISVEK